MTPSLGAYVGGCIALAGIGAALGLGGYWLRRWIVPEFSGALARLAEVTIAVALLVLSLELVGTIGIFRLGWIVLGSLAFLDDNPYERAEVRRALPEVDVPVMPEEPTGFRAALEAYPYLEPAGFTEADRARAEA